MWKKYYDHVGKKVYFVCEKDGVYRELLFVGILIDETYKLNKDVRRVGYAEGGKSNVSYLRLKCDEREMVSYTNAWGEDKEFEALLQKSDFDFVVPEKYIMDNEKIHI